MWQERAALRAGMAASRLAPVEHAIPALTDHLKTMAGWSAPQISVLRVATDRVVRNLSARFLLR
jgi:hypothetical protein